MCSCKGIAKFILIVINLVFLLLGGLMLAFGIVARVRPDLIFSIFSNIPGIDKVPKAIDLSGIVNSSSIFMIILGSIVFLVGFFGCFGACCESRCLLTVYIVFALVILCAEVALIIFALVSPDKLKNSIQDLMTKSLEGVNDDFSMTNGTLKLPLTEVSLGWAVLQVEAQCCGARNYSDYKDHHFTHNISGKFYNSPVPLSCCDTREEGINVEQGIGLDAFKNYDQCLRGNSTFIESDNCFDAIYRMFSKSLTIAVGIAAAIIACELIIITAAICLCQRAGEDSK